MNWEVKSNRLPGITSVSRETIVRLEIYENLLHRWQKIKNLVAPSTLPGLWTRHFTDSAQLVTLAPQARKWVDLGSGAGFPGLVIAILLADFQNTEIHLVESDHRKCAFLREVARETGAPALVHNARVEAVIDDLPIVDIVTARALIGLPSLLELSSPLLKNGALGLFLKGQDVASELTDAPIFSRVKLEFLPSLTEPSAKIVKAEWNGNEALV